jgi:hypothetical protein
MLPAQRAVEAVRIRRGQYGHPAPIYEKVAGMWSEILDTSVSPQQVALCMIALKLGRECVKHHDDNLTDICGYANVYEMILGGDDDGQYTGDAGAA